MPDHQHPSPAGDELVERLKAHAENWSAHTHMAGLMLEAAAEIERYRAGWLSAQEDWRAIQKTYGAWLAVVGCSSIAEVETRLRSLESALASERSARQAAEDIAASEKASAASWCIRAQAAEAERAKVDEHLIACLKSRGLHVEHDPFPAWMQVVRELSQARVALEAAEAERERLREAVKPFLAAFDAAEARYRERGGDPQWFGDNAAWFDVKPSLIVKGRQVVPTELHAITLKGPYRRLRALASQQEGAG